MFLEVLGLLVISSFFIGYIVQGGPKNGPFLNVDNFATVSGRKVCDMSEVCKFCLEKKCKTCIAVCLNILCLICINVHYPLNYTDNNAECIF